MNIEPAPHHAAGRTRSAVVRLLLERGPSTVPALAAELGLTVPAVRRHVEALEAEGQIVGSDADEGERRSRGRPARRYALTPAARASQATAYDALARSAVRYLARTGELETFAAAWAEETYAPLAEQLADAAPSERARQLAELLSARGYAGTVDDEGHLCQHNCPVVDVAREHPEFCSAETEVVGRLVGTPVRRLRTIATGSDRCVTYLAPRTDGEPASPADPSGNSGIPAPPALLSELSPEKHGMSPRTTPAEESIA